MSVDTSIYSMINMPNGDDIFGGIDKYSDLIKKRRTDSELSRIYKESNGDLNKMLQIGQQSPMARWVVPQLQAQQAAQQKLALDNQKTQSEIYKNMGSGGKDFADAGNTTQKTGVARIAASMPIFESLARTGDLAQARSMIDMFENNGTLDPATAQSYREQAKGLDGKTPDQIKAYGFNLVKSNLDPKYNYTTADNVLDNKTSNDNNFRTTQATINGQQLDYNLGKDKLEQDKILEEQRQAIQSGEIKEIMTGTDGKAYALYKNGKVEPSLLPSGEQFTPKPKGTGETTLQSLKRKETSQNHASASSQAAMGSRLAASIANRYIQGGYNPVTFAAQSKIVGTDAYGIAKDLESLKSNAFLSRAGDMRGLGALTETEGARLVSSVSPLDPLQSRNKFISDLTNVSKIFGDIAKSNRDKAKLYANPDGKTAPSQPQQPQQQTQNPAAQNQANKGDFIPLAKVKEFAKKAGIGTEEAIHKLQSQGMVVR